MRSLGHQHWRHTHSFGQEDKRPGELRTILVIVITGTMMVVEIAAGILFGSMALLADGLHMASHAAALSINVCAYIYARRHAHDSRYSFGTGKVNTLGGYTGAVLLAMFAVLMGWESIARLFAPVAIAFNQAIVVAVLGLVVNGASVLILGHGEQAQAAGGGQRRQEPGHGHRQHGDHNLRAAYLHVLADALTSILAIAALLAGKMLGLVWMDPLMGIVGALLVSRWSLGLLRTTSAVLLDRQVPEDIRTAVSNSIEVDGDHRVVDLHVWPIGPDIYAAIIAVVARDPLPPERYKAMISCGLSLVHVTVEVHRWADGESSPITVRRAERDAQPSGGVD